MTARRVAISRDSARVLPFDPVGRLLLMEGGNPTLPEIARWWFPMGGGVVEGEDLRTAALPELSEEVGISDVTQTIVPEQLPELIEAVLGGGHPAEAVELVPIHVGG